MKMKMCPNLEVGKTYELDYNGYHATGKAIGEDDFLVLPGSECSPTEKRGETCMMIFDMIRDDGVLGKLENGRYGFVKSYHDWSPLSVAFAITAEDRLPSDIWKEIK